MLAFRMSSTNAEIFFSVCIELKADTIEKRMAIMKAMVDKGMVDNIVQTKMSTEEYVKHIVSKFGNVRQIKGDNEDVRE